MVQCACLGMGRFEAEPPLHPHQRQGPPEQSQMARRPLCGKLKVRSVPALAAMAPWPPELRRGHRAPGRNCAEQACITRALLMAARVRTRPIAGEVNIQPDSFQHPKDAQEVMATCGLSVSPSGPARKDHRWPDVFDDAAHG